MPNLINLSATFGLAKIQNEYILTSQKALRQVGSNGQKGFQDTVQKGGNKFQKNNF